MARPIKETPVLTGRHARKFDKQTKENEKRKVSESEYRRAMETYNSIKFVG